MLTKRQRLEESPIDESSRQVLQLAERLRDQQGGHLDDAAILAIAEATGAPVEYVRLTIHLLPEKRKSLPTQVTDAVMSIEPDVRRHLISGFLGTLCGLLTSAASRTQAELFSTLMLVGVGVACWNAAVCKERRTAAITGSLFGGVFFVAASLFDFIFETGNHLAAPWLPFALGAGALGGIILNRFVDVNRDRLGLKDPQQERRELLRQLVDLQEKLRSGEQTLTFLCVDVVGSTKIKANADPLSVEYTFSEYHSYVESVTKRYGGRVHSTAGDGVICAFDHPQQAFGAARNLQAGLVEVNAFRNKVGVPIQLRIAVHTGDVVAPDVDDVTSVNFAHVIDIASHLQRVCPPGGVVVSKETSKFLQGLFEGDGLEKVSAQDVDGIIWRPKTALA